jgi:hypothetical protein
MSRPIRAGGKGTRKRKASTAEPPGRTPEQREPDAVPFESVDWDRLEAEVVELDPALVERIRARRQLKPLTLRVGIDQIAEARRVAAQTGAKYQAVLRRWLAEGASRSRALRMQARKR